jgi:cytoskeleton protein RodZ
VAESSAKPPENTGAAEGASAAKPRSIGERLRAGRDRSGLSVVAAAEKLHLDPKVIEALESDRFAELGAPVYVRGHLKRYAEFVGENPIELLNLHVAREARPAPPDLTQVPHPERRADPRRLVTPLAVLASAGALVVLIWWVLSKSGPVDPPAASANPATEVVPADGSPVNAAAAVAVATPAAMSSTTASSSPVGSSPAGDRLPAAANTAPAGTANPATPSQENPTPAREPAPARETRLRLELVSESWVEVYDSRGERLFFDVASAGSVQSITGRGPLRVFLGNAAGVSVEVDGQAREIPGSAIDGEGARFVVNRSGSLSRAR